MHLCNLLCSKQAIKDILKDTFSDAAFYIRPIEGIGSDSIVSTSSDHPCNTSATPYAHISKTPQHT